MQSAVKIINEKFNLTNKQMSLLKREHRNTETMHLDLKEKINHLNQIASQLKSDRDMEKIYDSFIKKYKAFNEQLNDNLLLLKKEEKSEVKKTLQSLNKVIREYIDTL